jgi:hypothetical protein
MYVHPFLQRGLFQQISSTTWVININPTCSGSDVQYKRHTKNSYAISTQRGTAQGRSDYHTLQGHDTPKDGFQRPYSHLHLVSLRAGPKHSWVSNHRTRISNLQRRYIIRLTCHTCVLHPNCLTVGPHCRASDSDTSGTD